MISKDRNPKRKIQKHIEKHNLNKLDPQIMHKDLDPKIIIKKQIHQQIRSNKQDPKIEIQSSKFKTKRSPSTNYENQKNKKHTKTNP